MNLVTPDQLMHFSYVLYIGDEAGTCIEIIEKFYDSIGQIEEMYPEWRQPQQLYETKNNLPVKLHSYIRYHFEGGILVFKFIYPELLLSCVKDECVKECRRLANQQAFSSIK